MSVCTNVKHHLVMYREKVHITVTFAVMGDRMSE